MDWHKLLVNNSIMSDEARRFIASGLTCRERYWVQRAMSPAHAQALQPHMVSLMGSPTPRRSLFNLRHLHSVRQQGQLTWRVR